MKYTEYSTSSSTPCSNLYRASSALSGAGLPKMLRALILLDAERVDR